MDEASDVILTLDQKYQELETPILVSLLLGMFSIINFKLFKMQIHSYYCHLLFVSGLGQCYDTTKRDVYSEVALAKNRGEIENGSQLQR